MCAGRGPSPANGPEVGRTDRNRG